MLVLLGRDLVRGNENDWIMYKKKGMVSYIFQLHFSHHIFFTKSQYIHHLQCTLIHYPPPKHSNTSLFLYNNNNNNKQHSL
mmetsp:Transcript_36434/g.53256  ORF Transcript_36434/g.53256 Transcript_36434/m.53256 type:complete len:81 (-) Transcript_36434:316-558(-)